MAGLAPREVAGNVPTTRPTPPFMLRIPEIRNQKSAAGIIPRFSALPHVSASARHAAPRRTRRAPARPAARDDHAQASPHPRAAHDAAASNDR